MSEEKKHDIEAVEVFKLKKSDITETVVQCKIYVWTCPLCNRVFSAYYRDKTLASAKIHLERTHLSILYIGFPC